MNVRYRVELSQAERVELTAMLSKGKRAARKFKRAQILLAADAGCNDEEIARTVAVGGSTIYRTRRRFVEGQSGTGAERGAPPRSGAQALRQGRSLAGGDGLRKPSRGARPLATGTVGRICGAFPGSTVNMSPAWKTCSTSMPRRQIPSGRWFASTKARSS